MTFWNKKPWKKWTEPQRGVKLPDDVDTGVPPIIDGTAKFLVICYLGAVVYLIVRGI